MTVAQENLPTCAMDTFETADAELSIEQPDRFELVINLRLSDN